MPSNTPGAHASRSAARRIGVGGVAVGLLASLVTAIGAATGSAPVQAASFPVVAMYELNEAPGASVMGDTGPFGLDGTVGNRVQTGATFGGLTGYRFPKVTDPETDTPDPERLVTVADNQVFDAESGDFAIEFRYRTTRSFGNIIQKGQNTTVGGYFKFEQPKGEMTCLFKDKNGLQRAVRADPEDATNDGQWHTIRCERRSTYIRLYIDGVQVKQLAGTLANIDNNKVVSIGGKSSCDQVEVTCDYFDGDIEYIRFEKGTALPANQPPVMAFSAQCSDLTCDLDAAASGDPDGTIEQYRWDYGDGNGRTDDDPNTTHTFGGPGVYSVTLTGTDDDGAEASVTQNITVGTVNQPPVASIAASCTGLACTFDGTASDDPDGAIASSAWEFGDGAQSTGPAATHTFAKAGTYTVRLTVTDDDGAMASATTTVTVSDSAVLPPLQGATRFVSLTPARVFDTRPTESAPGPKGVVQGGDAIEVDVTGVAGVPATGVSAVAINLTAIGIEAPSFVTAWATGTTRPTASSLNIVSAGQVRANLVVVPVGADGTISLYSLADAHLLGDIAGYYTPQSVATTAGRTIVQSPKRLFDTRTGPDPGPKGLVEADETIEVAVEGTAGVPATGAAAVVLNVTATGGGGPGFVTVWDDGTRPTASVINLNGPGESVPNMVIVPISADGTIRLSPSVSTHLLADVLGYVTDTSAASSVSGLFVPLAPSRVFDTRPGEAAAGPKGLIPAGATIRPRIEGVAGIPANSGAVLLNVTMIGTAPGYATLWPAAATQPGTSNVNVGASGDVRPNGAVVALGAGGDVDAYVSSAAHLLADVAGYFVD